jgi:hypothetical protein
MAMNAWTADEIELVAAELEYAASKFRSIVAEMRSKQFDALNLQAQAAFGVYTSTIVKLSGTAESEFRDQYRCAKSGETPRWKQNQIAIELRTKRNANLAAQSDLIQSPPGTAKTPAKKQAKPSAKKPSKKPRPT